MSSSTPAPSSSSSPPARGAFFEPVALLLLSLATVGTAWCSFQAAVWSGAAQQLMNLSAHAGRRAVADQLRSSQMALLDVLLFSQYVNARANSNDVLSAFYAKRFRGEAKEAFEAWVATRPFENADAPAHPFLTNYYRPRLLEDARIADAESDRQWQSAGEAARNARSYVLITVLLASALFCGGTASKFEALWIRRSVLALGLAAFAFAAGRMSLLPVQL